MAAPSLNCFACKKQFHKNQDWLQHLTQDNHQNEVRKTWSNESYVKECCLVVCTEHSLTQESADTVIQYFSNQTAIVTDFVWGEGRPKLAILRFENRSKVENILNCMEDPSQALQIENESVRVRAAFDMDELEWEAIIPHAYDSSSEYETESSDSLESTDESSDN